MAHAASAAVPAHAGRHSPRIIKEAPVALHAVRIAFFFLALRLLIPLDLRAAEPEPNKEAPFLKILESAYAVSCKEPERLREFYRSDAQILHDGDQKTLEQSIVELKQSMSSMGEITCGYHPRVRASRVTAEIAYLVVREQIKLSARPRGEELLEQICSYIFLKDGSTWKIAVDHCSTVEGETT